MKIISWNIDGTQSVLRKSEFNSILWMLNADIFAFQETKLLEPDYRLRFPGTNAYWSFCETGDTTHPRSGTAVFSKKKPKDCFTTFLSNPAFDTEGRIITLEYDFYYFVNVYVPQSQDAVAGRNASGSVERKEYRAEFDRLLREHLMELDNKKPVIAAGDFNAAIGAIDMSSNSRWQDGDSGFSIDENDRLRMLLKSGLADTFREKYPDRKKAYTHWSLGVKDRQQDAGRRLDYIFISEDLKSFIEDAGVYPAITGSDHCPIDLKIDMTHPVVRNEKLHNITYDDMLERERTRVFYHSLKDIDLSSVWETIDWNRAEEHLREMQRSIAKAAYTRDPVLIKRLQYDLVASLDAKLLAVRSVADRKSQYGVDKVKWSTPSEKVHAAISLTSKGYNARPAKLVEKKMPNGKERRLHVDTYYDRAMQTLYGYSLAPVAESWSDRKSFANRRGRNTMDADYYIRKIFSGEGAPQWLVKADIMRCYESLDHDWIRSNIPMASRVLSEFLKAGYLQHGRYYDTDQGVGVGSRLSPYISNMSMDGLQDYLYDMLQPGTAYEELDFDNGNMIRFCDDIVVSVRDMETAREVKRLIRSFMGTRGLILSEDKTAILHVSQGFDFLGRHYEKKGDYLISSPAKSAVTLFKNKIGKYIMSFKGSQERLIEGLNRKIVGFVSYHKMTDAYETFRELDAHIRICLFRLCEKRCPTYSRERIIKEFWFTDERGRHTYALKDAPQKHVIFMDDTIPTNYRPLALHLNPFIDYDEIDSITHDREVENVTGDCKKIWARQQGLCEYCHERINPDDIKKLIEIDPSEKNFTERMGYIHERCKEPDIEFEYDTEVVEDNTDALVAAMSDAHTIENVEDNPLYLFFKETEKKTVTLSFKRIAELSGRPMTELAESIEFWTQDRADHLCRCWLDNDFHFKRLSTEGRRQVVFHKYRFTGETAKVFIPSLLLNGEVPVRMKYRIEAMLRHEFEENGLAWA